MNISFGKKIPIATTQIQNRKTYNFEPATIYEVDCTSVRDYIEARKNPNNWTFAEEISESMEQKYRGRTNDSFYILQNKNKETIGRLQIERLNNDTYHIETLDTKKDNKYKFVGRTLLATVAKEIRAKGASTFCVSRFPYYIENYFRYICGFNEGVKDYLFMSGDKIDSFIARTEKETKAPIIKLKA